MEKAILHVEGMTCEHCVKAVTEAAGTLPGVSAGPNQRSHCVRELQHKK